MCSEINVTYSVPTIGILNLNIDNYFRNYNLDFEI